MPRHTGLLENINIRYRNALLLISSIVLLILAVSLVNLLITQTFKPYFNCDHMIDATLNTGVFCNGFNLTIGPYNIGPFGLGPYSFPILPALKPIDGPLEVARKFVTWNIILVFAVISVVLTFIARKIMGFLRFLLTPEGRKVVLTNLSIWLLFFVLFCALFYFSVVLGKG